MGSNMAECHPVAFRWVMKGKEKGTKLVHVDPRFTRTSAVSDQHVPIRAGTDIVFLGALINLILSDPRWLNNEFFKEYAGNYTNLNTIVSADFKDTEELDGLFSGFNPGSAPNSAAYATASWQYQRGPSAITEDKKVEEKGYQDILKNRLPGTPKTDPTWQDPQTVYQILKRHYARYTADMVERVCGTPKALFLKVFNLLIENSGREKTSAFVYSVGWAQHSIGVQIIRTAGMVQALLGNMGRPGAGILALRGHASIQGSTDISTLYHSWNGYISNPDARKAHDTLKDFILAETITTSYWSNTPAFTISMLKAWFGDAATAANEYGYNSLPKITGDHSTMPMFVLMNAGGVQGMLCIGQNPAVGGQNAEFQRQGMQKLEWMVVRDYFETETAAFWKQDPSRIDTEVFFGMIDSRRAFSSLRTAA